MQPITCLDWNEAHEGHGEGYREYEWAPTSDPRVLAVIQRDPYSQISELYDGDAINPILYTERRGWDVYWENIAGYDDDSASIITRADERLGSKARDRYLWIFHGIVTVEAHGGYDRSGSYIVVCSNAYLEHIGNEPYVTREEALADAKALAKDLEDALDGYVYGIGYATNEERRLYDDGEEIDLTDGSWEIEMQCWGFVGEEYAKQSAAAFESDYPDLPEMLDLEVTA
jgi:hypothetical protein